uniref:ATP-dependent DNA helicase n=1 Tax=Cyprinus carpio TaxID=7962 RepID=A0A8C2H5Q0_CYPCA
MHINALVVMCFAFSYSITLNMPQILYCWFSQTPGPYKKSILEDDLPYLEFGGTVIYSQERHDCSFLSEDLRSGLASGSAVGFDLEWPPSFTKGKTKKVAVVQLCASEEKCYLFHISSMSGFPPGLKMLLEDENIKKVGVGIEGDKWKLLSDYDIRLKSIVELSDLANKTLRCGEKWSLDGLVKHLLKKQLFKDKLVRCSHWDDYDLTEDQKRYAATDAYVSQYKQLPLKSAWNGSSDCLFFSSVTSILWFIFHSSLCLCCRMSNIPACFLGSAQTKNLYEEVKRGHFRVVYMTPEFCSGNIPLLAQLDRTVGLSLVAVDEAHCISQWGHDFRSAYRDLWKLKKNLPGVPILALTATASPSIREDIVKSLNLINPLITCTSFDRPNLYLDVSRKSGDVIQDLKQFLIKKTGGGFALEGSAIVYCPSKKEAERVTAALCKLDIPCGVYHAGLSIKQRRETQHQFMRDEIQCVVATVAFGMGINKSDIRKVIHYGAPKEMESYYQEIGRAGRDGLPSACHVLWMPGDMALNRFILNQSKSERFRDYKMDMMAKMEKYLNSTKCRRKLILCHFEDKRLRKVTSGIMGSSNCCDNCRSGEDPEVVLQDFGSCAYQLMKAISAMDERFGITAPILFLRGSTSQRVPDRFWKHSLFGIGRATSETWWKALSRELVAEKYLMETTGHSKFSTLCKLTPKGRSWLSKAEDERHRQLLLQPNRDLFSRECQCMSLETSHYQFFSLFVLFLQSELYGKLVSERQKLAGLRDIPPALLATNKILLDMAKSRPCSISSLKQVDGVSEAKAAMLTPLIDVILTFCQTHGLQVLLNIVYCTLHFTALCLPRLHYLKHFIIYILHLHLVADARSLPMAVVESHLLQAQKMGCAVDTDRAGLSASIYNTIRKSIASPPVSSGFVLLERYFWSSRVVDFVQKLYDATEFKLINEL